MTALDAAALSRLIPYVHDALEAQESHVADQLRTAMQDRRTELRHKSSVVGTVAIVVVDGYELCEVTGAAIAR